MMLVSNRGILDWMRVRRKWPVLTVPERFRVPVYGGLVILGLLYAGQLAYPASRTLPFSSVGGEPASFVTESAIARRLATEYKTVPLRLTLPNVTTQTSYAQAGFSVDTKRAFHEAATYRWWQRLIPLSLFIKGATTDVSVHMQADKVHYDEFAKDAFAACRKEPVNAGVRLVGTSVELSPAQNGYMCDSEQLREQLAQVAVQRKGNSVKVPLKVLSPKRSDKDVAPLLASARKTLARTLSLQDNTGSKQVPKEELAAWLQFDEKPDGKLAVAINTARLGAYIKTAHNNVYVAPRATVVSTLDGAETERTPGTPGKQADEAKTASNVQKAWLEAEGSTATAAVVTVTVAPPVQYSRSYSATQAGLQALVEDLAKDKGDYAISVQRGGSVTAKVNATKQYHPASTYKMFVAWAVLKRVEAGQMKWSDTAEGGKTVEQCFEVMIVNSNNPCGEWFGVKIGWTNLNNQLKSIGLTCTNLSTAWLSCAQDETLFLSKLEAGQLMASASRDRLVDAMKRQVYRSGVPAGVGVPVADKVGFIDGYLHDAAIVYAPKGTYEVTIMTRGSSWAQIADAARQIQAQLNRM